KIVKISRPPGTRYRGAPAITRLSSSQPSAPPLSAAAVASRRACPGGVGICGGVEPNSGEPPPPPRGERSPRRACAGAPVGARCGGVGGRGARGAPRRGERGGPAGPAADLEHALAGSHGKVAEEEQRARLGRLDLVGDAKETAPPGEQEGAGVAICQGRAGSRVEALP